MRGLRPRRARGDDGERARGEGGRARALHAGHGGSLRAEVGSTRFTISRLVLVQQLVNLVH